MLGWGGWGGGRWFHFDVYVRLHVLSFHGTSQTSLNSSLTFTVVKKKSHSSRTRTCGRLFPERNLARPRSPCGFSKQLGFSGNTAFR